MLGLCVCIFKIVKMWKVYEWKTLLLAWVCLKHTTCDIHQIVKWVKTVNDMMTSIGDLKILATEAALSRPFEEKVFWKFTGEYLCQCAISIKMLSNFIEIALWHAYSSVHLLHIFRTPFLKNTSGGLLL